ncbi:MAG: amidase family protein [Candidatus Pseudomonas phytovorans]|uniref:Amidase family protein n=1 Tax=Candidatus Pseudomonas phytovorans TaxID=3121377 RepID=A0AAJ6BBB7_9PSED|nr:amidase family protein [Pseudomonas sp.]WEK31340.1 MAG: amidase family protein [Pseudomonas sp.]
MNNLQQNPAISVIDLAYRLDDLQEGFDGPVFASIIDPDSNDFATLSELQQKLAEGNLTSVDLVTRALARISALNEKGPQLRAVIETNPDALTIAQDRDAERFEGVLRGPLHGIPVLLKDNLDSGDGMQTSAGSLALVGEPAAADAYVVQRLRASGAIILGKANTSEWMGFRDWTAPLGWSGRGGQTRSALGRDFPVYGSSAGSAVAVSAGIVAIAVGTETNGSLVGPAYCNHVVGLRPTLGLLSQYGMLPLSSLQDTPGPMARTVTDAALLVDAMFGLDRPDQVPEGAPQAPVAYAAALDDSALWGVRLGYPVHSGGGATMADDPAFAALLSRLESAGATVVPVQFEFPDLFPEQMAVLSYDFKRELARYLAGRPGVGVKSLADVIAFNTANPLPEGYAQGLLESSEALAFNEEDYTCVAHQLRSQSRCLLDTALQVHDLAALIDLPLGYLNSYGAQAGYPGLTVPAGLDEDGRPTGLCFIGPQWSDGVLLSLGYAFEQSGR